ncbi:MAG: methionine ABC transporter substrate-binding protein [Treponema sp.]|jgi:D-methionine transport system substrate-binding protein|nr:methionine ABC transporter substrate-binding protein [Treponema sp.]
MKRTLILSLPAVLLFILASCSSPDAGKSAGTARAVQGAPPDGAASGRTTLKIVADVVPHQELLEFVKPGLAARGIDLDIYNTEGRLANEQTSNGEFDANFFQHEPYLKSVAAEQGFDLVNAGNIHVEPIGAYSEKYRTIEGIPPNAAIAIPNDATNEFRALTILAQNGFIRLKKNTEVFNTSILDVEEYLKPIKLVELDAAAIIRIRDQFDVYITNTNKVLEAGIDTGGVLFREGSDSPYANILAVQSGRLNDPAIRALVAALTTEEVRAFIESKYRGAVIPAF